MRICTLWVNGTTQVLELDQDNTLEWRLFANRAPEG